MQDASLYHPGKQFYAKFQAQLTDRARVGDTISAIHAAFDSNVFVEAYHNGWAERSWREDYPLVILSASEESRVVGNEILRWRSN